MNYSKGIVVLLVFILGIQPAAIAMAGSASRLAITYTDRMVINHQDFKGYAIEAFSRKSERNGQKPGFKFAVYQPLDEVVGVEKQPQFYTLGFLKRREINTRFFTSWWGVSMDLSGQSNFDPEYNPFPLFFGLEAGLAIYPMRNLGIHMSYNSGVALLNAFFSNEKYNIYGPKVGLEWKF